MIEDHLSIEWYGYLAAFLTTVAFIPQLYKIWATKSSKDISRITLIVFIIGLISWIIYGYFINSIPIMVANIITLILNVSILCLNYVFSEKTNN